MLEEAGGESEFPAKTAAFESQKTTALSVGEIRRARARNYGAHRKRSDTLPEQPSVKIRVVNILVWFPETKTHRDHFPNMVRPAEPEKKMFKNCRKEDLRIVALELGETVAEKVTIVELTEIIKENKYFKEDVEFVKELIQYTIEDRKRVEEDRKKEAENRLRKKELELARLNIRVNSDNERTGEGCNTLDALVKSVRILTVKVPNRPEAITEDLVPTTKIDFNLNNIPNLKLADKNFNIPERVQMLLGAEVFYELMLPGQFKLEGSNVIFQNTVFGFVVSRSTSSDAKGKEHCGFIQAADNLEHSIKKFWEIENVEIDSVKTSELDICEDHFKNTHLRER
ncbi:integrase catalytic domain-containing protein [Trichonephila clavipes]|nr:integrase catalytic domain-containing protein [Trichonephila clavipes]